mmetsp:Transcript_2535/g.6165  ORF Transcript_2535/g.6165 Transcript_2535/m.6165 type:complete len:218 (-) Transcript_2535:28-681(-)
MPSVRLCLLGGHLEPREINPSVGERLLHRGPPLPDLRHPRKHGDARQSRHRHTHSHVPDNPTPSLRAPAHETRQGAPREVVVLVDDLLVVRDAESTVVDAVVGPGRLRAGLGGRGGERHPHNHRAPEHAPPQQPHRPDAGGDRLEERLLPAPADPLDGREDQHPCERAHLRPPQRDVGEEGGAGVLGHALVRVLAAVHPASGIDRRELGQRFCPVHG